MSSGLRWDRPTLVTGGGGFVGRHVVERLLKQGQTVWVVDNLLVGRPPQEWVEESDRSQVTFVGMDVREFFRLHADPHRWKREMDGVKRPLFGDVFHFAAVVGGRGKIDGDPLAVAQDLAIDADFFLWAAHARPDRVLYPSSSAAYPVSLQQPGDAVPLKEEFIAFGGPLGQPDMTYGWAKLTGEYLAVTAARAYGLHVACVRPFSGYGEDQDPSYPIPAIAERAARKEDPLTIWGSGEQGRDFVHIEDCIDSMLLAIERIGDGSAVNIGSGRLTTFREVAALFAKFAGYAPRIHPLVDKPMGVAYRFADPTRARTLLGWEPRISLEEGLLRVYTAAVVRLDRSRQADTVVSASSHRNS